VYLPARLPNRAVVPPSNSRSPSDPTSLPVVKPNRCSVSISSAHAAAINCASANNTANDVARERAVLVKNAAKSGRRCPRHRHACRNRDVRPMFGGKCMPGGSSPGEFPDNILDYYLPLILMMKIRCCNSTRDGGRRLPVDALRYVLRIGFVELRTQRKQTLGGSR